MATNINVKLWQERVEKAKSLQQNQDTERDLTIRLWKGEFFNETPRSTSVVHDDLSELNFVYEFTKVKIGGIYARNPHIFVRSPANKRFELFAQTMEVALNYYWRNLNNKKKIKRRGRQ